MPWIEYGLYRFKDVLTAPSKVLTYGGAAGVEFECYGYCTNAKGDIGLSKGVFYKIIVNPFDEINGKSALTVSYSDTDKYMSIFAYKNYVYETFATAYSFKAYIANDDTNTWETSRDVFFGVIEGTDFGESVTVEDPIPWKTIFVKQRLYLDDAHVNWFHENTERIDATIKRGYYRFKDVINIPYDPRYIGMNANFEHYRKETVMQEDGSYRLEGDTRFWIGFSVDEDTVKVLFEHQTVYNNGWCDGDLHTWSEVVVDILHDTSVTPDFYKAFIANTIPVIADITHLNKNGISLDTIAMMAAGQRATIKCEGKKMRSDLYVSIYDSKPLLQEKTATMNGEIIPDDGFDGLSKVTVAVGNTPVLQEKIVNKNGTYTADQGFDALRSVTVNVPAPLMQEKTMTENGNVLPDEGYDGLSKVTVNVAPILQEKTVYENGWVYSDMGYDGLSAVNVEVPMPRYYGGEVEVLS